jgi:hypothetical protein
VQSSSPKTLVLVTRDKTLNLSTVSSEEHRIEGHARQSMSHYANSGDKMNMIMIMIAILRSKHDQ